MFLADDKRKPNSTWPLKIRKDVSSNKSPGGKVVAEWFNSRAQQPPETRSSSSFCAAVPGAVTLTAGSLGRVT